MTRSPVWAGLWRGAAAGAAGTTALNAVTYGDVALRARPQSDTPQQVVTALADRADLRVPGSRGERARRVDALGPLAGTATGIGVGAVAGVLRSTGLRLPAALGGPLLGAAAMLAGDGPATLLGLTDPRRWSATDWVADAVPHLVYGITTYATLEATYPADHPAAAPPLRRPTLAELGRAAALGAATGARSTAGVTAVALTSRTNGHAGKGSIGPGGTLAALLAAGELVADKLPATPARTAAQGLLPRAGLGAGAAAAAARRDGTDPALAGLVGLASALGATVLGLRVRTAAHRRLGTDIPCAVAEDAVAALLGWLGTRRPEHAARPTG